MFFSYIVLCSKIKIKGTTCNSKFGIIYQIVYFLLFMFWALMYKVSFSQTGNVVHYNEI